MERYGEKALRSDAANVRQRHLCVHRLIGLMELEKRKPCLSAVLRDNPVHTMHTHALPR